MSKMDDELDVALGKTIATLRRELAEARWLLETGTSGEHETVDPDEWESRKDALLREIGGKGK